MQMRKRRCKCKHNDSEVGWQGRSINSIFSAGGGGGDGDDDDDDDDDDVKVNWMLKDVDDAAFYFVCSVLQELLISL
jgi:phosphopantothenoylcysteine synthetase/decarboxylase